jgi:predicted PurR-regulated permease PerM
MNLSEHLRVTAGALKSWFIAQLLDSCAVGILWWIGLHLLGVSWAPLWGLLAGVLQFVPHLGPVLGLIGPVLAATLHWKDWQHPAYVLILYALIAVGDGLLLQPIIMKRTSKVPLWASILVPLAFGFLLPFWGVLLAPPLLAVVFAYRDRWRTRTDRAHGG